MEERELAQASPAKVPTSIGPIEVSLYDHDGDPKNMGASAVVRVKDQDGDITPPHQRADDIRKVLSTAGKQHVKALLDEVREIANTRILGGA